MDRLLPKIHFKRQYIILLQLLQLLLRSVRFNCKDNNNCTHSSQPFFCSSAIHKTEHKTARFTRGNGPAGMEWSMVQLLQVKVQIKSRAANSAQFHLVQAEGAGGARCRNFGVVKELQSTLNQTSTFAMDAFPDNRSGMMLYYMPYTNVCLSSQEYSLGSMHPIFFNVRFQCSNYYLVSNVLMQEFEVKGQLTSRHQPGATLCLIPKLDYIARETHQQGQRLEEVERRLAGLEHECNTIKQLQTELLELLQQNTHKYFSLKQEGFEVGTCILISTFLMIALCQCSSVSYNNILSTSA